MILYCIITWLMGIGIAHSFKEQDKKSGKKSNILTTIAFISTTPLVLPIILGMMLGDYFEEKD